MTLLLSGCAGLPGYPAATDTPLAQLVDGVDCQAPNLNNWIVAPEGGPPGTDRTSAHPDALKPGMVPTGFEPVAAYRCTFCGSVDNSEGRWSAVALETLEGDFGPLLEAPAALSDRAGSNQVCSADIEFVPELWLENANGDAVSDIEGRPFDDEVLSTMFSLQFGTFASATTLSTDAAALLPSAASADNAPSVRPRSPGSRCCGLRAVEPHSATRCRLNRTAASVCSCPAATPSCRLTGCSLPWISKPGLRHPRAHS